MIRIVVGVDGSEQSARALAWAAEEARRIDGELVVVHAWTIPALAYGTTLEAMAFPLDEKLHSEDAARATVAAMLDDADLDHINVRVRLVNGPPGEAIVDAARDADMIVVGSRGRGALADLVLGSTTKHVTRHASVPVVVIPAAAAATSQAAA